jgi:hypothetical protein
MKYLEALNLRHVGCLAQQNQHSKCIEDSSDDVMLGLWAQRLKVSYSACSA